MTVDEVAAYMRVRRETVWTWCRQKVLPAFKVGREWRIREEDLHKRIRDMELAFISDIPEGRDSEEDE